MTGPIKRRSKRACDLCFAKRIKCDQREPECSNCKLYHRECRRSVHRSKKDPPTVRPVSVSASVPASVSASVTRSGGDADVHVTTTPPNSSDSHETAVEQQSTSSTASASPASSSSAGSWTFDIVSPTLYYGPSDSSLWVPPLEDLIPIIDYYFLAIHPSLPLFSQPSFMRALTTFLSPSASSSTAATSAGDRRLTWASILVVTALTLQSDHPSHIPPQKRKQWLDYCLRNAQSLLAELTARQEDLLGLQVILGLALSFRTAVDVRPASVLVAVAVRLVYQMQLYSQDTAQYFSEEEVQQRINVFWITYVMDMNISLRLKAPSTLSHVWIDIPKPSTPASVIYARDRTAHINVLHERVKLAEIESQIYTLLYSTRSSPLTPPERQTTTAHVESLLDDWYAAIPDPFRPDNAPISADSEEDLLQISAMYNVYLFCRICSQDLWNEGNEWARRVSSLSRAAMKDIMVALQGPKVTLCTQRQVRPPMVSWGPCVVASRQVTRLFHATSKTTSLTVQGVCALWTASLIMLANIVLHPTQAPETTADDFDLVAQSRRTYDQVLEGMESVVQNSLNIILDDLHKLATRSITTSFNAQPDSAPAMMGEKTASALDPALLGFDETWLGFPGQGMADFDFSDIMTPGVMDTSVFDLRSMAN